MTMKDLATTFKILTMFNYIFMNTFFTNMKSTNRFFIITFIAIYEYILKRILEQIIE